MTNSDDQPTDAAELRGQAEAVARERAAASPINPEALSPEETMRTLHELRVHQIELEMQNEELRRAQTELEATRSRYVDLYDLAPVGYVTLTEQGVVQEANLTAAALLGVARRALVAQPISRFIHTEDQELFYLCHRRLVATGGLHACELRMLRQDGTSFWAHLDAVVAQDEDGEPLRRVVLSDINERRQAEEALRQQTEELHARNDALSRFNQVAVGRELRMVELKREVNELCDRLGESRRHTIAGDETAPPVSPQAQSQIYDGA